MRTPSFRQSRRSGFTLVEVAIALAIFVFGALAIVRIFPPALGVIRNNESRTAATQMGQSLLARLSTRPHSIPDAVYHYTSGGWDDALSSDGLALAVVGTISKNHSLPLGPIDFQYADSALDYFKRISGERHVVQDDASTNYVLLNFPFNEAETVRVYVEDSVEGVQLNSDGSLDFSYAYRASDGASFSDTANPSRPVETPTGLVTTSMRDGDNDFNDQNDVRYYVSYRWRYSGGRVQGVLDEPLSIPDNANWSGNAAKVAQGLIASSNQIIPGGVTVRYKRLAQIFLANSIPVGEALRGYLELSGLSGTVSVEYSAADWRFLVDEGGVPSASDEVQLTVNGLSDEPLPGVTGPAVGLLIYVDGSTAPDPTIVPTVTRNATRNDYKTGTVTYTGAPNGVRLRTVYQTTDGWAQQLSVAAKSYLPHYSDTAFTVSGTRTALTPQEEWREYFWDGAGNLYFHASEAGKSVAVSLEYNDGGTYRVINNAVLTISDDVIDTASIAGFPGSFSPAGKVSRAEITDLVGNALNASAILSVQGLSIRARTAWLNNDRYNHVIVPAYRQLMQQAR